LLADANYLNGNEQPATTELFANKELAGLLHQEQQALLQEAENLKNLLDELTDLINGQH